MRNKQFDSALCEKTDSKGRELLTEVAIALFGATHSREINEGNGMPNGGYRDMEILFPQKGKLVKVKLEVELSSDRFQFNDTCHVPYRKDKNTCDFFLVLCEKLAWFCSSAKVKESPVKELYTKSVRGLEPFFNVEWDQGRFLRKEKGQWQIVKGAKLPLDAKYMPL